MDFFKLDIEKLEKEGTVDLALDLTKYIKEFLDRKYPLTKEDYSAIINDKQTQNVEARLLDNEILYKAMMPILESKAIHNKEFLDKIYSGEEVKPQTFSEEQEEIRLFKEQMLEELFEYHNSLDNKTDKIM